MIAAHDCQRAIGRNNALPWHLPDDLKRFKALTIGKTIVMGRKTAQSLGRALPQRRNIVLSRSGSAPFAGMEVVNSIDQALQKTANQTELVVIGGGEIYALFLPMAKRLHLTLVNTTIEDADAFFPAINMNQWETTDRQEYPADERHIFSCVFEDMVRT